MTHRFNLFLLALILLIAPPYYWFFIDNGHGPLAARTIDIAQARQLAGQISGPAPYAIELERPGFTRFPGNLMVAGSGIKGKLAGYMAFRLLIKGNPQIMIDTGINRQIAGTMRAERFDPPSQARIERELGRAGLILVTHEHPDHLGALAMLGGDALSRTARLNPAQTAAKLAWRSGAGPAPRLSATAMQAVAPGVVVIPAPASHTPGSQMIYVRLESGREYLFVGDLASFAQNWEEQRGRSRLVEKWFAPENRDEVFAWLAAIKQMHQAHPGIVIVPGHDYEAIADPENKTGIRIDFSTP